MGKRDTGTAFEKRPRDFYGTIDPVAAQVLLPYIKSFTAAEPCYGDGDLVKTFIDLGYDRFVFTSDIRRDSKASLIKDGLDLSEKDLQHADCIVTNPPFTWSVLRPLMDHWLTIKPTWLLLPADMMHNKRMAPYMKQCNLVLSVGRMYWMENRIKGVDNYCWYHFDTDEVSKTTFKPRKD